MALELNFFYFCPQHESTPIEQSIEKTKKMKKFLPTLILSLLVIAAFAQPGNPTNPVPLDGGISLLIAAGAAFGAKKIYDARKND